ncbi:MAG TPA: hypothetical protein VIA82_11310 [Candidatus Limnocylindria bacterium]|jgi:hypothetical protein
MLLRRSAPFLLVLTALAVAPSSASASTPLPTTVVIDASPPAATSQPPMTTVDPPREPAPSPVAPAAIATPQPSMAPAAEAKPVARLSSSTVDGAPVRERGKPRDRTRPRPSRTSSAQPSGTPATGPSSGARGLPPGHADDSGPTGPEPILLWSIGAIGGAALVGSTWLLVVRRRAPVADALGADRDGAFRGIPSAEQQALRRARLRQDEDPILAGLGLDEDATRAPSPTSRRGGLPRP